MAHIEETGLFPSPLVALDMTEVGILQGHGVPRKGDHFGTPGQVKVIQLSFLHWA